MILTYNTCYHVIDGVNSDLPKQLRATSAGAGNRKLSCDRATLLYQLPRQRDRVLDLDLSVDSRRQELRAACAERDDAIDRLKRLIDLANAGEPTRVGPTNEPRTAADIFENRRPR